MPTDLRRAALHALIAAAAFSITGACVKAAAASGTPNAVVVFVRCLVSLLTLAPWLLRDGFDAVRTQRPFGHLARASFGVASMYCFFWSIGALPLATAMLLTYSTPLWIPFVAWIWLRERPSRGTFPAVLLGLAGIVLMLKPDPRTLLDHAALVGVSAGMLAACAMVGIRRITDTEPPERIVFYFALLATVISTLPLAWAWQTPALPTLLLLIVGGIFATVGQLHLTRAYSLAPAASVGPFTYVAVPFSALVAWLIWDEHLPSSAWLGALLVIATCILVSRKRPEPHLEE